MTVHRLALATDVYVPPERAYEFLLDFPNYPRYTDVLEEVRRDGSGDVGTEYHFDVAWWRISRTVRSRVTGLEPPRRIEWRLLGDLAVQGRWHVDPPTGEDSVDAPTRVRLTAEYDPAGSRLAGIGGSALLSSTRVRRTLAKRLRGDAESLLERIVADLEGSPRPVDLEVLEWPNEWTGE